jgi:hypothetical protein
MVKLKQLLLRYDLPGIGLETAADGAEGVTVTHHDMPSADQVASIINALVDQLVEGEAGLLTKKRLRQLLCRLYQIDDEPTDDEAGYASPAAAADPAPAAASGLQEDMPVVLIGLKGKQQVYNGETGKLLKLNPSKDKYEVLFKEGQEPVKVKGAEHIVPRSADKLAFDTPVFIGRLRNHVELSTCLGRVSECHEESPWYEVRATESGQLFRVKQERARQHELARNIISENKISRERARQHELARNIISENKISRERARQHELARNIMGS